MPAARTLVFLALLLVHTATHAFSPLALAPATTRRCQACSTWRLNMAEKEEEEEASSSSTENNGGGAGSGGGGDILNSPAFLQRKLEVLQSDLIKLDEEYEAARTQLKANEEEWGPQLDDLQKEYQKIQQRMTTQNTQGDSMATVQVARQMLDVLDNYDRAFGVVTPETPEQEAITEEYQATYQEILDTLKRLGVEEVETLGVEFDYQVHQAVMSRPSDEYEEGIVCEEFQKGFKFVAGEGGEETLVRAAMVAVAA